MTRNQIVIIALLGILAATGGGLLARQMLSDPVVSQAAMSAGTLLQPPQPLPQFDLVDHASQPFTQERLQKQWTLLFFGFTNCPDVCPTTLGVLAQVEKSLQDLPVEKRPHIALVSVDPERDTPQQLSSYVKFFSPSFIGVTGSKASIDAFTEAMHVPVAISKSSDGSYTVDHSASVFLIGPSARLQALFSAPLDPQKIAADYRLIVTH